MRTPFTMTGWVPVADTDGINRGHVRRVVITRAEWKRHAPGIRDANAYSHQRGRPTYKGQAAVNLIAGWVADERHESACDSRAAARFEETYQ